MKKWRLLIKSVLYILPVIMALSVIFSLGTFEEVKAKYNYEPKSSGITFTQKEVGTWKDLSDYLSQNNANYKITLTKDIDGRIGESGEYNVGESNFKDTVLTIGTGVKVIDLNGNDIEVGYDANAKYGTSTLFSVKEGAILVINDAKDNGTINYDGALNNNNSPFMCNRDIFAVDGGELRINGGNIKAGRSSKIYNASKAKNYYKQINGTAITVNKGKLYVNGGHIEGRGFKSHTKAGADETIRAAAIAVVGNGAGLDIEITDGEVLGYGCADCISGEPNPGDLLIKGGHFNVEKQDNDILATSSTSSSFGTSYGYIGFHNTCIISGAYINEYKRGTFDYNSNSKKWNKFETDDFEKTKSRLIVQPETEKTLSIIDENNTKISNSIMWDKVRDLSFHLGYSDNGLDWYINNEQDYDLIKKHERTITYSLLKYDASKKKYVSFKDIESKDGRIDLNTELTEAEKATLENGSTYFLEFAAVEKWSNKDDYTTVITQSYSVPIVIKEDYKFAQDKTDTNYIGYVNKDEKIRLVPHGTYVFSELNKLVDKGTIDYYKVKVKYYDKDKKEKTKTVGSGTLTSTTNDIVLNDVAYGGSNVTWSVIFSKSGKEYQVAGSDYIKEVFNLPNIKAYELGSNGAETEIALNGGSYYTDTEKTIRLKVPLDPSLQRNNNVVTGCSIFGYMEWYKYADNNAASGTKIPVSDGDDIVKYYYVDIKITDDGSNDGWYGARYKYPEINSNKIYLGYVEADKPVASLQFLSDKLDQTKNPAVYEVNKETEKKSTDKNYINIRCNLSGINGSITNKKYIFTLTPPEGVKPKNTKIDKGLKDTIFFEAFFGNGGAWNTVPEGIYTISGYVSYTKQDKTYVVQMPSISIRFIQTLTGIDIYSGDTKVTDAYVLNCELGSSKYLRTACIPSGAVIDDDDNWSSADPSIAEIDNDGKVTFKKCGTTEITCTKGNFAAKTTVCVINDHLEVNIPQPVLGEAIPHDEVIKDDTLYKVTLSYVQAGETFGINTTYNPIVKITPKVPFPVTVGEDEYIPSAVDVIINGTLYRNDNASSISSPVDYEHTTYTVSPDAFDELTDPNGNYIDAVDVSVEVPVDGDEKTVDGTTIDNMFKPAVKNAAGINIGVVEQKLVTGNISDDDISNDVAVDFTKYEKGKTYRIELALSDGAVNNIEIANKTYFEKKLIVNTGRRQVLVAAGTSYHNRFVYVYFTAEESSKDTCEHEIKKEEAKAATCTEKGNKEYYYCSNCEALFEDIDGKKTIADYADVEIEAKGHDWGEWNVKTPATETEEGVETRACKNDPSHTETRKIGKTGHSHELSLVPAEPVGCTKDGKKAYYKCSGCDKIFEDADGAKEITDMSSLTVKHFDHSYGVWQVVKEATDTEEGMEQRICEYNSSHIETRVIPKKTHVHVTQKVEAIPATCEKDGRTEYYECKGCELKFKDKDATEKIVDESKLKLTALGHDYGAWEVVTAATETSEGEEKSICKNDPTHVVTRVIPKTTHKHNIIEVPRVAATCNAAGNESCYKCSECGLLFSDKEGKNKIDSPATIKASGHDWGGWKVTKPATETEKGIEISICKNDPSHIRTRETEVLSHKHALIKVNEKSATCTENGTSEYYVCSCGKKFSSDPATDDNEIKDESKLIIPAQHKLIKESEIAATCEENGTKEHYDCSVCGRHFLDAEGKVEYTENNTIVIPATGHKWGEWTVVTPASEEAEGAKERVCENDNTHKQTLPIPKIVPVQIGDTFDDDKYTYVITSSSPAEVSITSVKDGLEGELVIPQKVKVDGVEYLITGIEDYAFMENDKITSLNVEGDVTIGENAFAFCDKLENVVVSGKSTIGDGAFEGCETLNKVVMQNGVEAVGDSAFKDCKSLETVIIPDSVTDIGKDIFGSGEDKLKNVTIYYQSTTSTAYNYATANEIKTGKHEHTWSKGWESDEHSHWHRCRAQGCDITSPADNEGYAEHTFGEWEVKQNATPDSEGVEARICTVCHYEEIRSIPKHAHEWETAYSNNKNYHWHECKFSGCSVTDNSKKEGYAEHQYGDWKVTKAATEDVEGSETRVCTVCGYEDVRVIAKLEKASVDKKSEEKKTEDNNGNSGNNNVLEGGGNAQTSATETQASTDAGNLGLKSGESFTYNNAVYKVNGDMTVSYIKNLKPKAASIIVPTDVTYKNLIYKVTEIGDNAFKKNVKLAKVTIGSNITRIGKKAFNGCKKLKNITVKTTVLDSVGANALKGINKSCKIKVPKKKLKEYKKVFKKKGQGKKVKIM